MDKDGNLPMVGTRRDQVKVMVGGAPVTAKFASEIGADIFARDASEAATRAKAELAGG